MRCESASWSKEKGNGTGSDPPAFLNQPRGTRSLLPLLGKVVSATGSVALSSLFGLCRVWRGSCSCPSFLTSQKSFLRLSEPCRGPVHSTVPQCIWPRMVLKTKGHLWSFLSHVGQVLSPSALGSISARGGYMGLFCLQHTIP